MFVLRRLHLPAAAAIALGVAGAMAGGCSAVSGLDGLTFDGNAGACSRDADCDTGNACKVGSCGADGKCSIHDLAHDPSFDDGNPCTTDTCENGAPRHDPVPNGLSCILHLHDGTCRAGECDIACSVDADCATPDRCAIGSCDVGGSCKFALLDGVPVPGNPQVVGDCSLRVCNNGDESDIADPTDLPDVGQCEVAKCSPDGHPIKTPKPARAACSSGGSLCDGAGHCVACLGDSDCPGDGNLCDAPNCTAANKCTITPVAMGTALPSNQQTPGDCHQLVCDGNGGQVNVIDQTDVHDDGNQCTIEDCDATGTPTEKNVANGTPCGNGLTCVSGSCSGCTTVAQCPSHPNEQCSSGSCVCSPDSCASLGLKCGTVGDNGCGASLNCNDGQKDNGETDVDCGGPNCSHKCSQGKRCGVDSDCTSGDCVDGYCCESPCQGGCVACAASLTGSSNGLCRAVTTGTNPHNNCTAESMTSCGHSGSCDGAGACAYYGTSVVCGGQCQGDSLLYSVCTAPNTCTFAGSVSCAPYTCRNTSCLTGCGANTDCAMGHQCQSGSCL